MELQKPAIQEWAVGVTTAPRKQPTLNRCLNSLVAAGWRSARVFAEPGSRIPKGVGDFAVSQRDARLGAWSNWFLGLAELFQRQPHADAYLMLQDDALLCRNLRDYLERVLWPAKRIGLISPYSSGGYGNQASGFREVDAADGLVGAVMYVFPNAAVRALLADEDIVNHRLRGERGTREIDTEVGNWASLRGMPAYYHFPSLVYHLGDTSTIWPHANNTGRRQAASFVGESFDALELVDSSL